MYFAPASTQTFLAIDPYFKPLVTIIIMKPGINLTTAPPKPNRFTQFLWWLSTAEKELLITDVVDGNRQQIIGMTVLATWLFASAAWTYFFSTVVTNPWLAPAPGLFMGFIILTIDRALIKGINKNSKNKILPLLFRALLAVTIGVFMAQPALLFMFKKEIKLQTALDNEKRKVEKSNQLTLLFKDKKTALLSEKENLLKEINDKYRDVAIARQSYLAETDGSGGTGKVGVKAVALAKKKEYDKLDADYQKLLSAQQLKLDDIETGLKNIKETISKEEAAFENYFNDGFLTQIAALDNLIKTNPALQLRYYLLVTILLLIELMPVIAKTILPSGSYDEKAQLSEQMEKDLAKITFEKEQYLKELYSTITTEMDVEMLKVFKDLTQNDRIEKLNDLAHQWKNATAEGKSFKNVWDTFKKEILLKTDL